MKKRHVVWFYIGLLVLINLLLLGVLVFQKKISFNTPSEEKYPIRGIDVSNYQGKIDWQIIEQQNVQFAFIKATEGSGHIDAQFEENWKNAAQTDLQIGAYHFFSFESSGKEQAKHFMEVVPQTEGMLPPVVDVEFYGDYIKKKPEVEETRQRLQEFLDEIEAYYGMKPIIYATESAYSRYIRGAFEEYPLWIRNVYFSPNISMPGKWLFWQYSSEGELEGYHGTQKYIDLNVFNGSREDWDNFVQNKTL